MSDDLATALSPARANEPKWQPQAMDNETKILTPLTEDTPMPESFKSMPLPKEKTEEQPSVPEDEALPDVKTKKRKKWWIILLVFCFTRDRYKYFLCFRRTRGSCHS